MKKNSNTLSLISEETEVLELLNSMKKDQKSYDKLLETLKVLGVFEGPIEMFIHEQKEDEKQSFIKLWGFDKNDNIYIIYASSSNKNDLLIIEKQTDSGIDEKYDFSLAKNFTINSDNIDYLRTFKEYNFRYGRLITDQKIFYSLFLGDNVGF